ncbi:MAG TPA: NAD-dependent epimerase/dehydratase family protein [Candidatus Deferrimicrobium sp.]|nr:NAD-dependent epimerase/dehydratase family protein [Candidatus Deferrimicrobium sp.]
MIVAITGINSGLGRSLVPKLQKDPLIDKIIGIDISDYSGAPEKIEFFKVDVRDKEGLEGALKNAEILIHLAFIVNPKKLPNLKIIYDINVNGSQNVFQAAVKNSVKKIVHLSSQSVYGHLKECPSIVSEETPRLGIKTTNFYYAHTKALVEQYLDEFEKLYPDIKVIRFRPPIITGPHFIQNRGLFTARNKKRIYTILPESADKIASLQFIHEEDLTDILILAIKRDLRGAYNVSSNILRDFSEFMNHEYGVKITKIPRFLAKLAVRLGRIWPKLRWAQAILYNSLLDTQKIEHELGWKPKYTTEECIREINR